ncbi:MAG: penicillin-binding protein activator [Saccharospirillaceae bacterium]|nr:penicillin-binding protein activator [Pseudomonadales bacterium]NRB80118.1 penicillin-binding protein activator [Saccharospirillaceae bacterium]
MKPNYFLLSPVKSLLFALLCTLFMVGCKTQQPITQQPSDVKKPNNMGQPLNLASEGQAIMLARDLIKDGNIDSAIGILKPFKLNQLALNEQQLYVLARGELAIARNDTQEALFWIAGKYTQLFEQSSKTNQMSLRFLRSDIATIQKDYLSAARERIFIDNELYNAEKQKNHDIIWNNLIKLNSSELESFLRHSGSLNGATNVLDIVGWLQLAFNIQNVKGQVYLQQDKLQSWLAKNRNHPAAKMLPTPLRLLGEVLQNQPKQIAVLVPMTGKYAFVGRSIQAGLLTEVYNLASYKQNIPNIMFYDTAANQFNVIEVYNQAVVDGAQFVIGPFLDKPVNELANYADLTVPVLFLRSTKNKPLSSEKTLQFDLSLNHEVSRVAQQAFDDGHRNAVIIYTKGSKRRQEFAQIFERVFTELGGSIVGKTQLNTKDKYIYAVKELMGIDTSEQRARALYKVIGEPLSNFEVRPRNDIDMIFMTVSQDESVRLKPIFNQQYASRIPFYAISEIYSGGQLPKQYDFDNIRLQTMPWKLQGVSHSDFPARDEIAKAYQANEASVNIAAQGVDAFNIMLQFEIFKQFKANTISGVTGVLYQASDGVIQTKRDWIIINNNKISNYDITQ